MGLKKYPKISDHWSKIYFDMKISDIIPRDYFKAIRHSLYIDDNSLFTDEPFGKMRTFINAMNMVFKENYQLEQNISIDESVIPFHGNAGFIYYIPTKPTKFGIKIHELCEDETGYCYCFRLDSGKKENKINFVKTVVND